MRAGPELPSHAPLRPRHLRVPLVRAREALLLRAVPPGPLQEGLLDLGHRARAHLRHPPLALLLEDDDARLHLGLEVRLLARRRRVELRLALERLAELGLALGLDDGALFVGLLLEVGLAGGRVHGDLLGRRLLFDFELVEVLVVVALRPFVQGKRLEEVVPPVGVAQRQGRRLLRFGRAELQLEVRRRRLAGDGPRERPAAVAERGQRLRGRRRRRPRASLRIRHVVPLQIQVLVPREVVDQRLVVV
mmetsp:Transcript_4272/g.12176  ORF Transcript_4272/g.12176 Transcript_4272/m.12176 type:complete len:248 (-) Transcript_4272:1095-1838(-)